MAMHEYEANCHCGEVQLSFKLPAPLEETDTTECTCSICSKTGSLFVYPMRSDVVFHQGFDEMGSYLAASKTVPHRFCKTCGSSVLIDLENIPYPPKAVTFAINARLVKDVDLKKLKIVPFDGANIIPTPYERKGPKGCVEPEYAFSCHCAAVVFTIKFDTPLDQQHVKNCNCSTCVKGALMLAYPRISDMTWIAGEKDAMTIYEFGEKTRPNLFCSTCGVSVGMRYDRVADIPHRALFGVNLRLVDHYDLKKVHAEDWDGAGMLQPPYQVPPRKKA